MKKKRDIEKVYSNKEFVAKLRRLADAIENGKNLQFKSPANEFMSRFVLNSTLSMKEKMAKKKLNFR